MSQWRWEFVGNTYDQTPIPFARVRDGDSVVATQAFIPIRMIDRDGIFWTAKSEETLVDPAYRGQRLFEKMYTLLFQYANEHEFAYVWGFTPANKAFARLDFTFPAKTEQLFLPFHSRSVKLMYEKLLGRQAASTRDRVKASVFRAGGMAARMLSAAKVNMTSRKLPLGLEIRTMEEPDQQAGLCCKRFIEQWGGTTIYRDSDYLQWRLFRNPYLKSIVRAIYEGDRLLGWVAFTLGDDGLGYLVDIFLSCDSSRHTPDKLIRLLLLEAILGTRNMGAAGMRGWRVNQHPFDRLVCHEARKVGFYHIKRGHSVVLYNCPAGRTRAGHGKFDDWYVNRVNTEGVLG